MVNFVENSIHVIGQSEVDYNGMGDALEAIGTGWRPDPSVSGSENLIEFGGRLCYMSFDKDLNPNVTRTRQGNQPYIANVLKSKHGSVIEHGLVNFAALNVTPVFTHELVRHRAGTGFSQLSGRFVRLDDISFMWPETLTEGGRYGEVTVEQAMTIEARGTTLLEHMEDFQKWMAEYLKLDQQPGETDEEYRERMDFGVKKKITSAMRRWAPYGVRTHIMFSANHRALRHMIDARNNVHAEEEPDKVFQKIGDMMMERFPNIYQDMHHDETGRWTFENQKV